MRKIYYRLADHVFSQNIRNTIQLILLSYFNKYLTHLIPRYLPFLPHPTPLVSTLLLRYTCIYVDLQSHILLLVFPPTLPLGSGDQTCD